MDKLFRLSAAVRYQSAIDEWLASEPYALFSIARYWFNQCRNCGDDVRELIHDSCPVACVDDAAFAYVNVFSSHVNVGFFTGAMLPDPHNLLIGTGKRMRHVKVVPGCEFDARALNELINTAYKDVKKRLNSVL